MPSFSQSFLASLGQPRFAQGMFEVGQAIGGIGGQLAEKKKRETFQEIAAQGRAAIANQNPAGIMAAAEKMIGLGMVEQGEALTAEAKKIKREINLRGSVDQMALRLGVPEDERALFSGLNPEQLEDTLKDLRKELLDRVPGQSPAVRKSMAATVGISEERFNNLNLAKMSDDDFNTFLSGQGGEVKFFQDESGEIVTRRVNNGLIHENGKWTDPAALNLSKPPALSKVETITNKFAEDLAGQGAKSFAEQYENAKKSRDALGSILRSRPLLDDMYTGTLANVKQEVTKIAKAFGIPVGDLNQKVANTEVYVAETGRRVAEYITNLGAGTGLSDADREFAKQVVAGEITYDKEALKEVLKALEAGARENIKEYEATYQRVKGTLKGDAAGALAFFPESLGVEEVKATPSRSSVAEKLLEAAREARTGGGI